MATTTLDPIQAMIDAADGQRASSDALKKMTDARFRMVMGRQATDPFFASLAFKLKLEEAPADKKNCAYAATNGKVIRYHPDGINRLTDDEALGVLAEEVLHCGLKHHARMPGAMNAGKTIRPDLDEAKLAELWNIGCDLTIHQILGQSGYTLPGDLAFVGAGKFAGIPDGKSAEEYFLMLVGQEPKASDGEDGDGHGEEGDGGESSSPCGGGVEPAGDGSESACAEAAAEWNLNMAQASEATKSRGTLPDGLARIVDQILRPKTRLQDVLQDFVVRHVAEEYTWSPPNRRFVAQGLYLPSRSGERLGKIAMAVDTSGSVGKDRIEEAIGHVTSVLEMNPVELIVLYHNTQVYRIDRWTAEDGDYRLGEMKSGGTSHLDVFEKLKGEDVDCLICLTDMLTRFPTERPDFDVLWASTRKGIEGPFGNTVVVE